MQRHAPEAVDISQETAATQDLYGVNNEQTHEFGRRCLLARRLVERGVRFPVQHLTSSAALTTMDNWDIYGDLGKEPYIRCTTGRTDKAGGRIAERNSKQRGLARRGRS